MIIDCGADYPPSECRSRNAEIHSQTTVDLLNFPNKHARYLPQWLLAFRNAPSRSFEILALALIFDAKQLPRNICGPVHELGHSRDIGGWRCLIYSMCTLRQITTEVRQYCKCSDEISLVGLDFLGPAQSYEGYNVAYNVTLQFICMYCIILYLLEAKNLAI